MLPAANTKSAPKTERMAAGEAKGPVRRVRLNEREKEAGESCTEHARAYEEDEVNAPDDESDEDVAADPGNYHRQLAEGGEEWGIALIILVVELRVAGEGRNFE